jgi:hypothetical protein
MTDLEELKAAATLAAAYAASASDAATYDDAVAAEAAIWDAYEAELKKTREENSNDKT